MKTFVLQQHITGGELVDMMGFHTHNLSEHTLLIWLPTIPNKPTGLADTTAPK